MGIVNILTIDMAAAKKAKDMKMSTGKAKTEKMSTGKKQKMSAKAGKKGFYTNSDDESGK